MRTRAEVVEELRAVAGRLCARLCRRVHVRLDRVVHIGLEALCESLADARVGGEARREVRVLLDP